ncbi:MAG: preprotein translocase subunit SecG [bacterium]|nr:preprotein translocase subunit SecG [bacterium]
METLQTILPYIQIVLSILIVSLILLQQSEGSLGGAFGGGASSGISFEKRGADKFLFQTTIVLAVLFVASAILSLMLR